MSTPQTTEPQATRGPRLGESSEASGTRGGKLHPRRRQQPPSDQRAGAGKRDSLFSGEWLLDSLARMPRPRRYLVGFSGGVDSTALLQMLWEHRGELPARVAAVHFDHGLQDAASAWQAHCEAFCRERGIPLHSERLDIDPETGNLEELARECRYRAVARLLGQDEIYLTAHHAGDQAETLFLNLMRGSGIEGLAGIPGLRRLARGWVGRPLLGVERADLEAFLARRGITWLTDPSNEDTAFDRNYLRRELFPLLEQRWPGIVRRLGRTARAARIYANAMAGFVDQRSGDLIADDLGMPLQGLLQLDRDMQSLVFRQWLRQREAPLPPETRLREFLAQLTDLAPASQPEIKWEGWTVKRYRAILWLYRNIRDATLPELTWQRGDSIGLGPISGRLLLRGDAAGTRPEWRIRSRRPGDRIRPLAEAPSRKIKQLFQDAAIPPWLRAAVPVLEWEGEAVALGDLFLGHRLRSWLADRNLDLVWEPGNAILVRLQSEFRNAE